MKDALKRAVKWAGGIAIPAVVTWVMERASKVFSRWRLTKQLTENHANKEALEKAQTPEERNEAARKITDAF